MDDDLRRVRERLHAAVDEGIAEVERNRLRARALSNPRIVRVSYVNAHSIGLRDQWDYIDGIGNLKIGDRVVTPRFQYPDCEGVVVAVDEPRQWNGSLKTIRERV